MSFIIYQTEFSASYLPYTIHHCPRLLSVQASFILKKENVCSFISWRHKKAWGCGGHKYCLYWIWQAVSIQILILKKQQQGISSPFITVVFVFLQNCKILHSPVLQLYLDFISPVLAIIPFPPQWHKQRYIT